MPRLETSLGFNERRRLRRSPQLHSRGEKGWPRWGCGRHRFQRVRENRIFLLCASACRTGSSQAENPLAELRLLAPHYPWRQIRSLEMLRRLRARHEIHYLALHDGQPESLARSSEYCSKAWPVPFVLATRDSARFWIQTARNSCVRTVLPPTLIVSKGNLLTPA